MINKFMRSFSIWDPITKLAAAVENINGKNKLLTDATVTVEQVFGQDPQATVWFYIGTQSDGTGVGSAGDTVRVQIPAAVTPLNTLYPAVDVTTTVTAPMVASSNPERALADQIVTDLSNNANFAASWRAQRIKDFSGVFISSKLYNERGERTSWTLTSTGTTVVTKAFDSIIRRGFPTELSRSPNDPRQGVLAIAGSISVSPGSVSNIYEKDALNGGSNALNVNGSITPVVFTIPSESNFDIYITEIRFHGRANGIKFGQFLNINGVLTNGILVTVKSENTISTLTPIKSTDNFKARFASVSGFDLDVQAGGDHFAATNDFTSAPIIIKASGTYSPDDYITVSVRDNLTSVGELFFTAFGFRRSV